MVTVFFTRRRCWFAAGARVGLIALVTAVAAGAALLYAQSGGEDVPLQIQRVYLNPDRAANELEKVKQGALVLLPRSDFEARLDRARKAHARREQKPHLAHAHYSAELIDRSLTNGSGAWTILHGSESPAILPIDALNLALSRAHWDDGADAILAELDGKSLGLLVSSLGKKSCQFDWSARGLLTNDGLVFTLAVPTCPRSTFDLKLPIDHWLVPAKNAAVALTGPHETDSPGHRLWRIHLTGTGSLEFTVRQLADTPGRAPTVLAHTRSTQKLYVDRVELEHEFQVDILHGSVRELILESDGPLQPYAVTLSGSEVKLGTWKDLAVKKDAKGKLPAIVPGEVAVLFAQPVQGKIEGLRVKSLASRSSSGLWTSPSLRVRGALPRGETVEIRLHPDLPVGKWDHGSFEPVDVSLEPDGTQIITLAQTARDPGLSRRPSYLPPIKALELHTVEKYHWQITPRGIALSAEIHFAPTRGSLFDLRVKAPTAFPGYEIESLETQPSAWLSSWHPDGEFIVVRLKQPITPKQGASLKLQFRCPSHDPTSGAHNLTFPEMGPVDAAKREGTLAIVADSIFRTELLSASAPPAALEPTASPASYRFTFRDQLTRATVRLIPQPVQVQLRGHHEIALSEQETGLVFRWEAKPLAGSPGYLDFRLPGDFPTKWAVDGAEEAVRVHRVERLHIPEAFPHLLHLGSAPGVGAVGLETLLPRGAYWRFHLTEPLRKKGVLTVRTKAPAGLVEDDWRRLSLRMPSAHPWENLGAAFASDLLPTTEGRKRWPLPLMMPVQPSDADQEIVLSAPNDPITRISADGLSDVDLGLGNAGKKPTQLRVAPSGSTPRINVWTGPQRRAASQVAWCDEAEQSSFVHKDDRIHHRIQFRLWHWRDRECEVNLPADCRVISVKVNGQVAPGFRVQNHGEGLRLILPVDRSQPFGRYDIVARGAVNRGIVPGLTRITLPRVVWPIEPLDVRARLFVEKDQAPVAAESLIAVGVPAAIAQQTETLRHARRLWNVGRDWWTYGESAQLLARLDAQRQVVLHAEAQLRSALNAPPRWADALERLALTHLKDAVPLVVDRLALQSLGISSDTVLARSAISPQASRPFWESLGLIYVPCRHGALLTSPERMERLGITSSLQTVDLDEAMQEAIAHGRDASTGFLLASMSLASSASGPLREPARQQGRESPGLDGDLLAGVGEMDEWEFDARESLAAEIWILDTNLARVFGWILAALLAMVLWRVHLALEPHSLFRFYVFFTVGSVLAVIWAPTQLREYVVLPTFFVGIVGVGWCVAQILRAREASPQGTTLTIHPPTGASFLGCAIGLLFLGLTWNGAAQTPPPRAFTVFVLDGAKPSVLGPPELIRRLDEMEQQAITDGPGAVLLSAKYVGKVKDTQALFDVVYELHSFGDKANVFVPLSGPPGNPQAGLQLIDAFLDGAPAFPAPHKTGFLFPIRGKGAHTLRVSFSVRVAADGDQLKLHYSIPKLIQNEVKLQGLSPTRKLVSLHGFGEEKWLADGAKPATPWHAQLGYEGIVHLRWANPKASPGPKTVEVKENHFWDLHPSSPALTSVLRYLVGNDSRASFAVSAPDGLHVRGVEVFKASSPGAPSTRVVVRSWNVIGDTDQRRLVIELAQPAGGEVTIQIEAVPFAGVKAGKVVLAPPAPLQGKSSGGSLAYRLNAKEVAIFAKNLNVQSSKTDEFEILGKKPAVLVTRAYRFERSAVKAALELVTQPNTWRAQGQLQWIVDAHHADLAGKVTITSLHADVAFLEFFADPALTIAQVAGADVARWQRQDSRLQIWLKQPRKETTLAIAGWRSTSMKSRPPEEQKIALPAIYPLNTAPGGLTLDVRAAAGLQLKVGALKRLRTAAPGALQFIVDEAPYEASFHVSPDTQPPDAFLLTKVQASERGFDYWHGIRLISKRGYLPDVVLRVADCPHGALLDAPGGTPKQVTAKTAKDQTWIVTYPRDLPQDVTLTVRASIAAHQGRKLTLPIVAIESVTLRNHGLAWTGVDIETGEPPEKLGHQKAAKDRLASSVREDWYTEVALWNHASAPRAAVAVLPPASLPTTTRVLASSEAIWPTTEGHWMHEAAYWIAATEETDLRVKFPRPVGSLGVWIDGGFLPAATPGRAEVTLRLTASREPRRIELRWRYAQDVEQSESPEVGAVKLEQAILPDHSRVLWMPPGTTAPSSSSSPTVVSRFLSEARAHMQISAALAQESRSEHAKKIATRQLQFRACIRQADYALACLKTIRPDLDLTTWQAHVRALDRQNAELAKEHRFEAQRQAALKAKVHALVPAFFDERITPGVPLVLSPTLPELALSTADAAQLAGQWTASYLLLLVGVFLLIASYFRHGWSVFQHAAPELAVALIGGVWALFGIGLIGAILLGMFALYRLWWLTVVLRDWFVGAAPTPDKAKSSSDSP